MIKNTVKCGTHGTPPKLRVLACSIFLTMLVSPQGHSKELWNIVTGKSPELVESANASAEALDAVIVGLTAFRDAEKEGIEVRKSKLLLAAEKLMDANKAMVSVAAKFQDDPSSMTAFTLDSVPEDVKIDMQSWLNAGSVGTPKTWGDFYEVGANATGNLAATYAQLAKREDNAVFRDFLSATYPYLRAGATASEIFSSEQQ